MTLYRTIVADPPWPYDDNPLLGFSDTRLPSFLPYASLTWDQIAALDVPGLALPGAHLYLWTTNRFLWRARQIAAAWGWPTVQVLVWCKAPMGLGPGGSFANTTEFCLFGRRAVGDMLRRARDESGLGRAAVHRALFAGSHPTGIVYRWEAGDCYPSPEQWDQLADLLPTLERGLTPEPKRWPSSWFQWPRGAHSAKPEAFIDLVEQVSPGPYLELFARRQRLGWDTWGNEAFQHVSLDVPLLTEAH